jgi:hypothetical protein
VTSDEVQKAREVRDAEKKSPGIVKKTIKEALDEGREPTKAEVKRAVKETLGKSAPPPRGAPVIDKRVSDVISVLVGLPSPATVVKSLR